MTAPHAESIGPDFCKCDPCDRYIKIKNCHIRCLTTWLGKLLRHNCTCFPLVSCWFLWQSHESVHKTRDGFSRIFSYEATSYTGPVIPREHRNSGSERFWSLRIAAARHCAENLHCGRCWSLTLGTWLFDFRFVLVPGLQTPHRQQRDVWECPRLADCQAINVFQVAVSCFQGGLSHTEKISMYHAKIVFHVYISCFVNHNSELRLPGGYTYPCIITCQKECADTTI